MPRAPNLALSFPRKLIKSKKGQLIGLEGTNLNLPLHNTNLGKLGSLKQDHPSNHYPPATKQECNIYLQYRTMFQGNKLSITLAQKLRKNRKGQNI